MGNALNKLLKHYRNVEKKKNEYKFGKILGCGSFGYICCALQYLHSNNIIHRDIKAENFLFKNKNTKNIKLIDFGMAKRVNNKKKNIYNIYIYIYYTMSSDIWALGVMVFFMLTGKYPFEGKNTPKVVVLQLKHTKLDEILNKNINWKGKEFSSLSIEAVDFLKRLLERNEKKRLTAYQALHHPWITSQVG
ncbi:CAMK protein kinase [Plasmodium falciparum NF135/5.C10]|uniref:CAMK protein kinase n=1 Tax=Plasmodium falciparum NF135/5.C10 TaxID=1036726 RepID=W4I8L6_PLAFA|nr:CAMK protein kinase [Plasmodium falciparum NF135/5.C10]